MLNKSFGVIRFHFNIFSEKSAKMGVNFYNLRFGELIPGRCLRSLHFTLM